ncbi:partitioning defective 6 homolog alpha-like, partial [Antrostomus carolinensis]|uniref:partitioning defective 6 homolog alpha-like n=1 Tax=Antrostomus carolinensis TaxID=279965 RepID=UPI0010A98FB9
ESDAGVFASNSLQRKKKGLLRPAHYRAKPHLLIGMPQDFRQISSIIDVDILPETHRRVRLHKHGSDHNLIITVKPANQRNNVIRSSKASGSSGMSTDSTPSQQTPSPASQYLSNYSTAESDEEGDLVIESDSAPHYI